MNKRSVPRAGNAPFLGVRDMVIGYELGVDVVGEGGVLINWGDRS